MPSPPLLHISFPGSTNEASLPVQLACPRGRFLPIFCGALPGARWLVLPSTAIPVLFVDYLTLSQQHTHSLQQQIQPSSSFQLVESSEDAQSLLKGHQFVLAAEAEVDGEVNEGLIGCDKLPYFLLDCSHVGLLFAPFALLWTPPVPLLAPKTVLSGDLVHVLQQP